VLKFIRHFRVIIFHSFYSNSCGSLRFEVSKRQAIFAIDFKNSTIKFTILTEVISQQQIFPLSSYKNVTASAAGLCGPSWIFIYGTDIVDRGVKGYQTLIFNLN